MFLSYRENYSDVDKSTTSNPETCLKATFQDHLTGYRNGGRILFLKCNKERNAEKCWWTGWPNGKVSWQVVWYYMLWLRETLGTLWVVMAGGEGEMELSDLCRHSLREGGGIMSRRCWSYWVERGCNVFGNGQVATKVDRTTFVGPLKDSRNATKV